jgi:protein SCO1
VNQKTLWLLGASVVVSAVLLVAGLGLISTRAEQKQREGPAEGLAHDNAARETLPRLWPAPPFVFTDHRGEKVTPQSFAGRPWIANFIFTQCRTVCPLLTAKMVQLQRKLPHPGLRFVSFSVDPGHDTPAVLADYARLWNAAETRWTLLSTDAAGLTAAAEGFHIVAEPQNDPDSPIMHSAIFLLVDGEGMVRGSYDTEDPLALARLLRDAAGLAGSGATEQSLPQDGDGLYHALSCAGCHERPELAPSVRGLAGKNREMTSAEIVKVDADYVRESILSPQQKRVRGYPLQMPSYDGLVPPDALETLVAWVLAQPAAVAPPPEANVVVDPVCHMQVRVVADTPSHQHEGKRHFFCAAICKERFAADPSAYLR